MTSLDGYISDKNGNFDWAEPDEEVLSKRHGLPALPIGNNPSRLTGFSQERSS